MSGSSTFSSALVRASRLKPWKTKPIFWLRTRASSLRPSRGDVLAVEEVAAGGGAVQAAEQVHEGGLAGAGRAHHRHELPGLDAERDSAQRVDGLGAHP